MDLRRNGTLSVKDSILLDEIEPKVREDFNEYVGEFITQNKLTGLDLLLTATCRNTIVSQVHDTFCRMALLEERLKKMDYPTKILVDNAVIAGLINQILKKYNTDNVKVEVSKKNLNIVFYIIKNFMKSFYTIVNSWLWSRLFFLKYKPNKEVLFVDTFLYKETITTEGHFQDRYYTGHEKYLDDEEKSALWFSPTLYNIRYPWEYFNVFRRVAKADRDFLIKEAWLNLSDYAISLLYSIIIPFKVNKYPRFRGYNISEMIRREILADMAALSLVRSLCQYRFIRRLSYENVKICQVLNWFENQVYDRALNLAFKKYYPEILVRGYQGFLFIGYYASYQPTCYELKSGTIPDILHVMNDYCLQSHLKVCDELQLELSPAFRFSYLNDMRDRRKNDEIIVFIPLPGVGFLNECIGIIKSFLEISNSLGEYVRAIVRLHPSYTYSKFIRLDPAFSDERIKYSDKSVRELLEVSTLMVSTASSVCVEAVSVGIPVAVYGSRSGVTLNPIPLSVDNNLWTVFYTSEELMKFFLSIKKTTKRTSIVSELFHPVNLDGTQVLFSYKRAMHYL